MLILLIATVMFFTMLAATFAAMREEMSEVSAPARSDRERTGSALLRRDRWA